MTADFDSAEFRRRLLAVVDGEKDFRLIKQIVIDQQEVGVPDKVLLDVLGDIVDELVDQGRDEEDQELVLNAMDHLVGW